MKEFEENDNQLVTEFKESVDTHTSKFYDAEEYEIIIEELISAFDFEYLDIAISKALEIYHQNVAFHLYKVKTHILKFELDIAEEELNRIEQDFEPTPEFYMEKVYLSNILNRNEDNIKLLKKALQIAPGEPDIHFLIGFELVKKKQFSEAIEHVKFALQKDITFEEQLSIFSFVFEEEKWHQQALEFYSALTEEFPFAGAAWFGLGLSYSWQDRYEDSIEAYKLALTCDNEIATANFNIGNSYFEMKQYAKAIEYYVEAHRLDKADFHSLSNIADCYNLMGKNKKALEFYRKTLDINPNHNEAIIGIAGILQKENKVDEARIFIEKAFANSPQDMDLLFQSLMFYAEEEQFETLTNLINLTLNQLEQFDDFFRYLAHFCVSNEFYEIGYYLFDFYNIEIEESAKPDMMNYYLAAFCFMTNRIEEGKEPLSIALLEDYDAHYEFLALSPVLETYDEIIYLIQQYQP